MKKFIGFICLGMLIAIMVLQLIIWDEIKKPKTIQISAPEQTAAQPTLADLQMQYENIQARYLLLQKMSQEDWEEEGRQLGDKANLRAPTLEDALEQNKKWMEELKADIYRLRR